MTGQEALNLLMQRLGNRSDAALRSKLLLELNEAKNRLEQTPNRPPLLITDQNISTVQGQESYTLPTGFLAEVDDEGPWYTQDGERVYLSRVNKADALISYGTAEPGAPAVYDFREKLFIYPIPDGVYNLTWTVYTKQSAIADSTAENTWLTEFGDLLIGRVGLLAANTIVFWPEAAAGFTEMLNAGAARYAQVAVDLEESNMDRAMGGEE